MKKWIMQLLFIVVTMLFLMGCSKDEETVSRADSENTITMDEIELHAKEFLGRNKEISEFTVDSIEFSHGNEKSKEVYLLTYSMKPSDPEKFVLAGSGIEGEDGWIIERVYYVTVKNGKDINFSTSSF